MKNTRMALNKSLELSSSDSDDFELPDLFDFKLSPDWIDELSPGRIIWADFRKIYWPAMVRCVYKKQKKISIWYLDSPKKTFKVSFSKVRSFADPDVNEVIREQIEKNPLKEMHHKVWINTVTFLKRRSEGHNDDPSTYFDISNYSSSFRSNKSSSKNNRSSTSVQNPTSVEPQLNSEATSSDEESLYSSSEEENVITNKLSLLFELVDDEEIDPRAEIIFKYIVTGNTNEYLLSIRKKKQPSKYHTIFEEAMKTDPKKLFQITACDVIKNTDKLREIAVYLINLYEKRVEGGKCEMVDYVMYVWLPEAINKAAEIIDTSSLESVEDIPKCELFPTDQLLIEDDKDYLITDVKKDYLNTSKCLNKKRDADFVEENLINSESDKKLIRPSPRKKKDSLSKSRYLNKKSDANCVEEHLASSKSEEKVTRESPRKKFKITKMEI